MHYTVDDILAYLTKHGCEVGLDNDGQIVLYTGLREKITHNDDADIFVTFEAIARAEQVVADLKRAKYEAELAAMRKFAVYKVIGEAGHKMADPDWFDRHYDLLDFNPEFDAKDKPEVAFDLMKYAIHQTLFKRIKSKVYSTYHESIWKCIHAYFLGEQPVGQDSMHAIADAVYKYSREDWAKFLDDCATFYCGDDRWKGWK